MKSFNTLLIGTLLILPLSSYAEKTNADLQEARSLAKTFGGELKSLLQTSMASGGPSNALEVCNLEAGPVADKISSSSGWHVSRTSLKVRNTDNEADAWESKTLLQFEKRKNAGEDLQTMEHSEVVNNGGDMVFRYMKAIPTNEFCVVCHGSNLNNELAEKVKRLYPNDKAIGFKAGDIRGAFSLQKQLKPN